MWWGVVSGWLSPDLPLGDKGLAPAGQAWVQESLYLGVPFFGVPIPLSGSLLLLDLRGVGLGSLVQVSETKRKTTILVSPPKTDTLTHLCFHSATASGDLRAQRMELPPGLEELQARLRGHCATYCEFRWPFHLQVSSANKYLEEFN